MALFKKNIWLIFYSILLLSFLLLVAISYFKWENIYKQHQATQENMVQLIINSTHSFFKTQEMLLDILGRHFIEKSAHFNTQIMAKDVDNLLSMNPSIAGFGFVTKEGKYLFLNSHPNTDNLPNLMETPESKDSFLETLASNNMVLGRTYFFKPLNEWVIPIRKTIRDEHNNILAVMTAGLKLDKTFDSFFQTLHHKENFTISLLRETDMYFQYDSRFAEPNSSFSYNEPIKQEILESAYQTIYDIYQLSPYELRRLAPLVSIPNANKYEERSFVSLQYDPTFKLWIIVGTKNDSIQQEFFENFSVYCSIFILIQLLIFSLFRIIAKAEAKRHAALMYQATHDGLTNLPNRYYLKQNIDKWLQEEPPFSILYIDIDNFKNINDTFGHTWGDALLVEIARRLTLSLPKGAIVLRHGGDEFIMFTYLTEDKAIEQFSKHLLDLLTAPYMLNDLLFNIGVSIGIAKFPEHGTSLNTLLRAADIALFEAKKIKNNFHFFNKDLEKNYLKNLKIEHELRHALEDNEFYMVYQPQVDGNENFYGVEALIRWNSKTLGIVPPNLFIPIVEATGLMSKLGHFIVHTTLQEMKEIQTKTNRPFHISINISVRQFMEPAFYESLLHAIEMYQLKPQCITLEVTENLFIEEINYIIPLLSKLREIGLYISMDDFGTGYSSLSMLRQLPINELKIDKSFVDEIVEEISAQKMVQNIIAIGKNLSMHILAEGVETKEQKEMLIRFGCDLFQGYYFAKPLEKEQLLEFIQR